MLRSQILDRLVAGTLAGRCASKNAFTSWYSSITPLYFDPATGLSSTVAFRLRTPRAIALYFSSSSSRVESSTTGFAAGGTFFTTLTRAPSPHPAESTALTANANMPASRAPHIDELWLEFTGTRF
jgi:hypothetical protein